MSSGGRSGPSSRLTSTASGASHRAGKLLSRLVASWLQQEPIEAGLDGVEIRLELGSPVPRLLQDESEKERQHEASNCVRIEIPAKLTTVLRLSDKAREHRPRLIDASTDEPEKFGIAQ